MPTKRTSGEPTKEPAVSLPEAATMAGVSQSTIRRWLDGGHLKATKNARGEWEISHHALRAYLATEVSRRPPKKASGVSPTGGHQEGFTEAATEALRMARERIADLEKSLERERKMADELRGENRALTAEIVKLSREMQALLSGPGAGAISRWLRSALKPNS